MEVALSNEIPTYSGGLGVLARHLRSAADLSVPIVGVSLVHRREFQAGDRNDRQIEHDASWAPERFLTELAAGQRDIEGRPVRLRSWQYDMVGSTGYTVPVLLLDTDVSDNRAEDRRITDHRMAATIARASCRKW